MENLVKKLAVAALIAAQVAPNAAHAADLAAHRAVASQEAGTFFGARVRLSLDGRRENRLRAGLVAAPTIASTRADGGRTLRFGEGLELGVAGNRPLALSIAGRPMTGVAAHPQRAGVSTLGWVAIGVGALVVVLVAAMAICMGDNECNPSE